MTRAEMKPLILEMMRATQDDTPLFNALLGVLETIDPEVDWMDAIKDEPRDNTERLDEDITPEHFKALVNFFYCAGEQLNERSRATLGADIPDAMEKMRREWNRTARIIKGEEEE